jgi:lipid II:glycine glycyltransferase (peptidoglycan interpeptide bridge formation enzyme)
MDPINALHDTKEADFEYLPGADKNDLIKTFEAKGYYGVLYLSPEAINNPQMYSKKQPPIGILEYIQGTLQKEIEKKKLLEYNIDNLDSILKQIRTSVNVSTQLVDESGVTTQTSTGIAMAPISAAS